MPRHRLHHEIFLHDREHTDDVYLALGKALLRLDQSRPLAIELTGGKKTMGMQLASAVSALRHRLKLDISVIYLAYDDYLPQYRKPVPEAVRPLVLEDPAAPAYDIFGRPDAGSFREDAVIAHPIFHGRGFEADERRSFVLMPFAEKWSDRIWRLIRGECSLAGFTAIRADDLVGVDILEDVWEGISRAALVIADLTNRNANVFYELGIAHTLGKRVILLTQNLAEMPSDMRRYRCIEYEDNADGYEMLRRGLQLHLPQRE
jgi:hypothetical protein